MTVIPAQVFSSQEISATVPGYGKLSAVRERLMDHRAETGKMRILASIAPEPRPDVDWRGCKAEAGSAGSEQPAKQ
jgi:hypothetical protein